MRLTVSSPAVLPSLHPSFQTGINETIEAVRGQVGPRSPKPAVRSLAGAPRQNEMVAVMEIVRGAPSQAAFSVMADR